MVNGGKANFKFKKLETIKLSNGAVITPVERLGKDPEAIEEMIDYLKKTRWAECRIQGDCIDAVQEFDGFSCEKCPLRNRTENAICFTQEKATEDADSCARLLQEAYR